MAKKNCPCESARHAVKHEAEAFISESNKVQRLTKQLAKSNANAETWTKHYIGVISSLRIELRLAKAEIRRLTREVEKKS